MEINPESKVLKETRDYWQKIAALIMYKAGLQKIVWTNEELQAVAEIPLEQVPTIIVHAHRESMDILLMPLDKAREYAARVGEPIDKEITEALKREQAYKKNGGGGGG
jgi:hypothetical protein